jgi:dTDP-4-dehydrorhamnose 3,5-epimerase
VKFVETDLPGVLVIEPQVFTDARGFFLESYNAARFSEAGIDLRFLQDNHSNSTRGVLRGLHYQEPNPQGKLLRVVNGAVFDVAVDIRRGSPHFGRWAGVELSAENRKMIWVPPGFAHGFCVISDRADVLYKCTVLWAAKSEHVILWNDPGIGIAWPVADPILSPRDAAGVRLAEATVLPSYEAAAAAR